MGESRALTEARQCLARAEADCRAPAARADLERGLDLLDEVLHDAGARHRSVAVNLCTTYQSRLYARIDALLQDDPSVPEPELERLLQIMFAFDRPWAPQSENAKALKLELVRRLIERYYEGHPPERKQRALAELAALAGQPGGQ